MMKESVTRSQCRKASVILSIGLIFFMSWVHIDHFNINKQSNVPEEFMNKLIKRRVPVVKENQKTILIWSSIELHPFTILGRDSIFQRQNCSYQNCRVTNDPNYFGGDLTKFDAIAFNGRNLSVDYLPEQRSPHQDYIYFNTEAADNIPVCEDMFEDFFTLTATYRLDSDIVLNYFDIRNKEGVVIGPKAVMDWVPGLAEVEGEVEIVNKTKAVAWFASNCNTRSHRMAYAKKLQAALKPYGYTLDIIGTCGTMKCPIHDTAICDAILRNEYYFYFSAENSICFDYITEKVLKAMLNDMIPIVYGGADYNRFLPPHSYLDAQAQSPEELAALIAELIKSPKIYRRYFGWKAFYEYNPTGSAQFCAVCEAINKHHKNVYHNFRSWWHADYENRCKSEFGWWQEWYSLKFLYRPNWKHFNTNVLG